MAPLDPSRESEQLARLLVSRRRMPAAAIEEARADAGARGLRLATALHARGALDLGELAALLGEVHGIESAGPQRLDAVEDDIAATLPARVATRALAVVVKRDARAAEVAFADPADASAVEAVRKALGARRLRVLVAPEALVWWALVKHHRVAKVPKPLQEIVRELDDPKARRAKRKVAPKSGVAPRHRPDEFITTPLGGVLPGLPDEVSTAGIAAEPAGVDAILAGGGADPTDPLGVAQIALGRAKDAEGVVQAMLGYAGHVLEAAAVLVRRGARWESVGGAGELVGRLLDADGEAPSLLRAAISGESGFAGAVPRTHANRALLVALGREAAQALLLPLCRAKGRELVLYGDAGDRELDDTVVERLRMLARRARQALES